MAAHRTVEITIESSWVMVVRSCPASRAWCPECGAEADFVGTQAVTCMLQAVAGHHGESINPDELHCRVEVGEVLICMGSLQSRLAQVGQGQIRSEQI